MITLSIERQRSLNLDVNRTKEINLGVSQSSGTTNYEVLWNKPRINSVELRGNKTGGELYLQDRMDQITDQEIDNILYGG